KNDRATRRLRVQLSLGDSKVCRLKRPISHDTSNSLNPSCTRRLSRVWIIHKWTVSVAIDTAASRLWYGRICEHRVRPAWGKSVPGYGHQNHRRASHGRGDGEGRHA